MPIAPTGPCGTPGCPNVRPCSTHPPTPWQHSRERRRARGATLTSTQEDRRRRRILRRWKTICHVCHEPMADEVDHVIPLAEDGPDTDDNLRPIHSKPCHAAKSKAERLRGLARYNASRA